MFTSKGLQSKCMHIHKSLNVNIHRQIHTKFAIVGGGTAGMNVASQLLNSEMAISPSDITVFDPSRIHYYQPGFTMVAGGTLGSDNETVRSKLGGLIQRPMEQVFDSNINMVRDSVSEYFPDSNKLFCEHSGKQYEYDVLIMASGIELRYDLTEGLQEALDDPTHPCGSMYRLDYALKMNKMRTQFQGGKIIATQPPMPIKCGGAPQKLVYLTEYELRKAGMKDKVESFKFYTQLNCMFAVKKYDKELRRLVAEKGIEPVYQTELVRVDKHNRKVYFKDHSEGSDGSLIEDDYDLLHVVPIQKANAVTANAPFSDASGFVDVNHSTLQSNKYENVFGLGDCCNCPCPKTAAAIFAQTPTVISNIDILINKKNKNKMIEGFNGYASCPIFVGDNKLMLAEFVYGGVPDETFNKIGIDQAVPRTSFYHLKKDFFPFVYWNVAPRGKWFGKNGFIKPRHLKAA